MFHKYAVGSNFEHLYVTYHISGHAYVHYACFEANPYNFFLDVLALHTPYSGALVSEGAPLVDPRL